MSDIFSMVRGARTALRAGAAALALALVPAAEAAAADLIGEYTAWLSPRDAQSSRGQPLTDICAIVQQDRANYHRFGLRDPGDGADSLFGSQEARAQITQDCRYAIDGFEPYARERLLQNGEPVYIWVRVYGDGDRPAYVLVREGAG
ncbi:MAG: hypothetical protein AAGG09_00145 [Pseudomonadota bacterium]